LARPKADGEDSAIQPAAESLKETSTAKPVASTEATQQEEMPTEPKVNLAPPNKIFEKSLLLRIWRMHRSELHNSVSALSLGGRPGEKNTPDSRKRMPTDRANVFGTDMKSKGGFKSKEPMPMLKMSEKGYKITEATTRMEELERRVKSLLNKICPDNLGVIVDRLAQIELYKAEELDFVIRVIFGKALAEPHYCETYADMVFALKSRYAEFPPEIEGEKPVTFTRVLLNTCQNEFENLPTTFEATAEETANHDGQALVLEMKRRKDKMLANMKFIGHLFLRQLLAVKVIGQVVHDLIGIKEGGGLPEEHMIECVCELLQAIGYTLDDTPHGENLMNSFAARLRDLSKHPGADGKAIFSKRICFQIENLLDLRKNRWQKKLFKELAKTKDDVRKDAIKEANKAARGGGQEILFTTQVVGARPAYIDDIKAKAKPKPAENASAKPAFDQGYVKKLFQYYAEDKRGDNLASDWNKAAPSAKDCKQGIEWLAEVGFNDPAKADKVAETIAEIMHRKLAGWEALKEAIAAHVISLEDLKIDLPQCDLFFHMLMSRLIALDNFSGLAFKSVQQTLLANNTEPHPFAWSLLLGTLRKVKERGGQEAVRKALNIDEFVNAAASARKCQTLEARRQLEGEL